MVLGPLILGEISWRKMGEWAVVAGASYGIGGHYAEELAKRGCNLIIIGHDENGLKDVEKDKKQVFRPSPIFGGRLFGWNERIRCCEDIAQKPGHRRFDQHRCLRSGLQNLRQTGRR